MSLLSEAVFGGSPQVQGEPPIEWCSPEVMSIQYDFSPEEHFSEEKGPAEKHKKPQAFEHPDGENGNHT